MAVPKDLQDVLGTLGLGSDQDEFAFVMERRGVSVDHIVRQVIIGKAGLKCTDNTGQIGFNTAQRLHRDYARRKDQTDWNWTGRTCVAPLIRYGGSIANSAFKSRSSQSFVSSVEILRVIENPNNDGF